MHPTILQLGPITLHSYGLMIAIGFLIILQMFSRDAQRVLGVDPAETTTMALWVLFLGICGTRLLHIIWYPEYYSWSDPIGWIALNRGGLVFQGALPAAVLYVWYALRKRHIPFWPMIDCILPWVPLAQAFGRMGCFLNGCCYGKRADNLPWALRFPKDSPPYLDHMRHMPDFAVGTQTTSFPVHPTQLYSVILLSIVCIMLLAMRKYWHPFQGFIMPMYLILYGIKRFIVEMYRGDGNPTNMGFGTLTNQQVFCIGMIIVGICLFFVLRRRPQVPLPPPTTVSAPA